MVQYFDSASLMRAYYRKFLTLRRGRGLPELVDRHILLLVMCAEFSGKVGGGSEASDETMKSVLGVVDKVQKQFEATKDLVNELKKQLGEVKSELNNIKEQVRSLKKKSSMECEYCGQPGHTIEFCRKKKADDLAKKKKKDDDDDE